MTYLTILLVVLLILWVFEGCQCGEDAEVKARQKELWGGE